MGALTIYARSIFGSSASRSPSPSRLKASTVKKIARLGNSATCGAFTMSARASFSIAPHSGLGGCAPRPMNDSAAAVRMEVPMRSEAYTITAGIVPGNSGGTILVYVRDRNTGSNAEVDYASGLESAVFEYSTTSNFSAIDGTITTDNTGEVRSWMQAAGIETASSAGVEF